MYYASDNESRLTTHRAIRKLTKRINRKRAVIDNLHAQIESHGDLCLMTRVYEADLDKKERKLNQLIKLLDRIDDSIFFLVP